MALRPAERDAMRELCLADPVYFLENVLGFQMKWMHRAWLEFALRHPKHAIEAPRGFGKSTVCTTGLVIWRICKNPNVRILIISRTETQALRFAREIRDHLERNELLKDLFGPFIGLSTWTDRSMTVASRTEKHKEPTITAMGLEGPIAGGHWNLIIADDPFDEETSRSELMRDRAFEWLFTTLMPTLVPGGSVGVRCTRYHYGDLAGRIERDLAVDKRTGECFVYRLEHEKALPLSVEVGSRWKVLQTPAIDAGGESVWPEHQPLEDTLLADGTHKDGLKTMLADMGARRFGEQYMMLCNEIRSDEEETECKRAWFKTWDSCPPLTSLSIYQFVDPAFRSAEEAAMRTHRDRVPDYYAIGVIGFDYTAHRCYVLDVLQGRFTPIEREEKAKRMADKWKPIVVEVERTGLQYVEAPDFYERIRAALKPHRMKFGNPSRRGDKVKRAHPLFRAMEAGCVFWNPEVLKSEPGLVDQYAQFPFGKHDDLVDCVSGAYLLGERRPTDLHPFAKQFTAPTAATKGPSRYTVMPGGAAPGASRYTAPGGARGPIQESRYTRPGTL